MLRRTQSVVLNDEPDGADGDDLELADVGGARRDPAGDAVAHDNVGAMRAEIERAFAPGEASLRRRPSGLDGGTGDSARPDGMPTFVSKDERRKSERRGMDALRDEALRNIIARVEDKNFGGLRERVRLRRGMKASRILLLVVALAAGGLAAFLATQRGQPSAQPAIEQIAEPVKQEATAQVLVARQTISVGQRLSPGSVEWQAWPETAVRPEHITMAAVPEAMTDMAGAVARAEFFPGEPIREQKLAPPGAGLLSAVLGEGMRGVSVSVVAESASGGFIVPNDHVDVVVTRPVAAGQVSETILHNVRVLAIDARLAGTAAGEAPEEPEVFKGVAIATLELDPAEAEVIIGAANIGKLSLVLRSILDFAEPDSSGNRPANGALRLTSPFWLQ